MKKTLSTFAAGLSLFAVASAQAASTADCLTPVEMKGLVAYFLPDVLANVTDRCSAHLPPGSYLLTGVPNLANRLNQAKPAAWPAAKAAFFKFSSREDLQDIADLPDEALRPLVDAAIAEKFAFPVSPSVCGEASDITEALAPLSAGETVHLLTTIFSAVARKDDKMRSCPRETR